MNMVFFCPLFVALISCSEVWHHLAGKGIADNFGNIRRMKCFNKTMWPSALKIELSKKYRPELDSQKLRTIQLHFYYLCIFPFAHDGFSYSTSDTVLLDISSRWKAHLWNELSCSETRHLVGYFVSISHQVIRGNVIIVLKSVDCMKFVRKHVQSVWNV